MIMTEAKWIEFLDAVKEHISTYTVDQYKDYPEDPLTKYSIDDVEKQIQKYINRFDNNQRGINEEIRDCLKIAHYEQVRKDKMMCREGKRVETWDRYEKEILRNVHHDESLEEEYRLIERTAFRWHTLKGKVEKNKDVFFYYVDSLFTEIRNVINSGEDPKTILTYLDNFEILNKEFFEKHSNYDFETLLSRTFEVDGEQETVTLRADSELMAYFILVNGNRLFFDHLIEKYPNSSNIEISKLKKCLNK